MLILFIYVYIIETHTYIYRNIFYELSMSFIESNKKLLKRKKKYETAEISIVHSVTFTQKKIIEIV